MLIGLDGRLRGRRMFDFRLLAVVFCACLMVFPRVPLRLPWAMRNLGLSARHCYVRNQRACSAGFALRASFLTLMAANGH